MNPRDSPTCGVLLVLTAAPADTKIHSVSHMRQKFRQGRAGSCQNQYGGNSEAMVVIFVHISVDGWRRHCCHFGLKPNCTPLLDILLPPSCLPSLTSLCEHFVLCAGALPTYVSAHLVITFVWKNVSPCSQLLNPRLTPTCWLALAC